MDRDIGAIDDAETRNAYRLYVAQRRIIRDFYAMLPMRSFDERLVETPTRKSDSPRESLIHILEVHRVYFGGITAGRVDFGSVDSTPYQALRPSALLEELDRLDQALYDRVADRGFEPNAPVVTPWGPLRAVDMLYALRDHDILHVGWNLALMDALEMPRFASLKEFWGD